MKKITSLFKRNYDGDRLVRDEVVLGAEWVQNGEGVATRKYDGTACMVKDGTLYKRYDVKKGRTKPFGFIPAQEPDENTGHWPGWIQVELIAKENKWYKEAWETVGGALPGGTYELCGPKVQSNPEHFGCHGFVTHGSKTIKPQPPRTFNELKEWFIGKDIEGIVWHRDNGDMVKIKKKDFGMKRDD